MSTTKKTVSVRRGPSMPTIRRTQSTSEATKVIKTRDSKAQLPRAALASQKSVTFGRKTTAPILSSPISTVRIATENKKVHEEVDTKPRLTALEELFPKHVLDEIRNNSEPCKLEKEDGRFYKLLVQSLYISEESTGPLPEQMSSEQLEQLISKTQKDMAEVEEKLQVKERQRARLLRWWEVKHDMLSYLFKCKSERERNPDLYIEHMTQSQC